MRADEKRRFGLFDVMILVAAIAFGLGLARIGHHDAPVAAPASKITVMLTATGTTITALGSTAPTPFGSRIGYQVSNVVIPILQFLRPSVPCLATLTAAHVVLRLRSPRPRRRRMLTQPGMVAALAMLAMVAVEMTIMLGDHFADGRFASGFSIGPSRYADNMTVILAHRVGLAVATAWFVQAVVGRWRPEKSWLDRSGRLIGVAWLIVGTIAGLVEAQFPFWGVLLRF